MDPRQAESYSQLACLSVSSSHSSIQRSCLDRLRIQGTDVLQVLHREGEKEESAKKKRILHSKDMSVQKKRRELKEKKYVKPKSSYHSEIEIMKISENGERRKSKEDGFDIKKKQIMCSNCKESGHNKRTCKKTEE